MPQLPPLPLVALLALGLTLAACSGGDAAGDGSTLVITTDTFSLDLGQEDYQCYAQTLEEDLVLRRVDYERVQGVHHLLLARTLAPEPEGMFPCNVLLRTTWVPLFGAGTDDATLDLPDDSAFVLRAGTQLLVQLHLLNTTDQRLRERVRLRLGRHDNPDARPAGIYAFGSTEFQLDPHADGAAVSDCTVERDIEMVAVLPHMHYLGTTLTFEIDRGDGMTEAYSLDSWNFDQQFIEPLTLSIPNGTPTRTTCTFSNPTAETVGFGESSLDEMCFFVTFIKDSSGLDGCITGPTDIGGGPTGDRVCEATPNELGIGTPCTRGGGECPMGLSCTADLDSTDSGSCISFGCRASDECGSGATCCAPAEGGGLVKLCLPDSCVPSDCAPL